MSEPWNLAPAQRRQFREAHADAKPARTAAAREETPIRELTDEERRAIASLKRLAKRWPKSLMLISMDSNLHVIRVTDQGAVVGNAPTEERTAFILADIDGTAGG